MQGHEKLVVVLDRRNCVDIAVRRELSGHPVPDRVPGNQKAGTGRQAFFLHDRHRDQPELDLAGADRVLQPFHRDLRIVAVGVHDQVEHWSSLLAKRHPGRVLDVLEHVVRQGARRRGRGDGGRGLPRSRGEKVTHGGLLGLLDSHFGPIRSKQGASQNMLAVRRPIEDLEPVVLGHQEASHSCSNG